MLPVLGGSSYLSQNSLKQVFGLGTTDYGRLDVLWPGGVRNRLYRVHASERIVMPEIPCSIDGEWKSFFRYVACVGNALKKLKKADIIDSSFKKRLFFSAIIAYFDQKG